MSTEWELTSDAQETQQPPLSESSSEEKALRDHSVSEKQSKNYTVASITSSLCSSNSVSILLSSVPTGNSILFVRQTMQQAGDIMDDGTVTSISNDSFKDSGNDNTCDQTRTDIDEEDISLITLSTDNKISDMRKCDKRRSETRAMIDRSGPTCSFSIAHIAKE